MHVLVATGLFTAEVWTWGGLATYDCAKETHDVICQK
jgi:hypothetical protein